MQQLQFCDVDMHVLVWKLFWEWIYLMGFLLNKLFLLNSISFTIVVIPFPSRLCLVPRKFEGKRNGKKIQRKSRKKEKVKKNKKNRLKVDKLFFLLLQTHFIYFNSLI